MVSAAKEWGIQVVLGWDLKGLSQEFADDDLTPLGISLDSIWPSRYISTLPRMPIRGASNCSGVH